MYKNGSQTSWIIGSLLVVIVSLFALRYYSSILSIGVTLDEQYIVKPINNIMSQGWSIETAIDFQETKGPAMIWPYAFFGKILGGELNNLRMVSLLSSILSAFILLIIALRSGCTRSQLILVAIGWLLIPYNILFSEIVMGEASFIVLSLLTVSCALWGIESKDQTVRWLAPTLYCICLAIALHSRIHIVAVAGAICFTAWAVRGKSSWPWWVASIIAGCLRIPLWCRWGGLVSPEYQALHGLGFRLESLTYLAAALLPFVGIFVIQAWHTWSSRKLIFGIFVAGITLGLVASPSLHVPDTIDFVNQSDRYQGIASTAVTIITSSQTLQTIIIALMAGLGLAGLASLWKLRKTGDLIIPITFWSLFFGWGLYAFTRGFVFDRFLMIWAFLLPIIWVKSLSKPLLALQFLAMTVIAVRLIIIWLF